MYNIAKGVIHMPILKIKELRENHGMTQMQVAQKLDIPLSTYRSYETGVREPGVNMLITLSELYGVTTDYLLNYSQKPTALNSDEIKHIKKYHALNSHSKKLVDIVTDLEYNQLVEQENTDTKLDYTSKSYLYDANYDKEIVESRTRCANLCYEYNNCRPSDTERQQELLAQILGSIKGTPVITAPFYCDYGFNISIGKNFYTNHNVTILDGAKVTFGDNVFIAPNCVFSTAGHAIDSAQRDSRLEIALPITVGDSVWFGTNVSVLPGVTIGSNTIIGAGSVVNKDIPGGVIAAGTPCKVIRKITDADKEKYPIFKETDEKQK